MSELTQKQKVYLEKLVEYEKIVELKCREEDFREEDLDPILSELDTLWWQMSQEEQNKFNNETFNVKNFIINIPSPEKDSIKDTDLADEIIRRLNVLIETPEVREAIDKIIDMRIEVGPEIINHPTIQVANSNQLGFLGLLNGIVGADADQWGYIAATYDEATMKLIRFSRK